MVTRLLGEILLNAGILAKGHVVETDRTGLIGQYVGQTTKNTRMACDLAAGGILFIDEAYSIGETSWYGEECIDSLVKLMEDRADDLMIVLAGYKSKMNAFLGSNPGLRSRFTQTIDFADYGLPVLANIFRQFCNSYDYALDAFAEEKLPAALRSLKARESERFANGRSVRHFFDAVVKRQAARIMRSESTERDEMTVLTAGDLSEAETRPHGNIVPAARFGSGGRLSLRNAAR